MRVVIISVSFASDASGEWVRRSGSIHVMSRAHGFEMRHLFARTNDAMGASAILVDCAAKHFAVIALCLRHDMPDA